MIKRALWIIASTLLLTIVAAFYWLLMTQSGFNAALGFTQKMLPALTIQEAKGRLYSGVYLQGVAYVPDEGDAIYIDNIDGRWQLWSLLSGRFIINQFHINKLQIKQREKAVEAEPDSELTLPDIRLPLQVHLRSFRIIQAEMIDKQGVTTLLFDRFDTSLRLNHDRLTVSSLSLSREVLAVTLLGNINLSGSYVTNLNYGLRINDAKWGLISATGTITGDIEQMTIRQQLGEPFASEQTLMVADLLDELQWQFNIESSSLPLAPILATEIGELGNVNLDAQGTLHSAKIELDFELQELAAVHPPVSASLSIDSADLSQWRVDLMAAIGQTGFTELHGDITVPTDPLQSTFALDASWAQMQWPWQDGDETLLTEVTGALSLDGSLQDYHLLLTSSLTALEQALTVATDIRGNQQQLAIQTLDVQSALANISVSGDVAWQPTLRYQLDGRWENMQIPATLSGVSVESNAGHISVAGEEQLFDLTVDSDFIVDQIPLLLKLTATSPEQGTTDVNANVDVAGGSAGFTGIINWQDQLLVDGGLTLKQLNPKAFIEDWPGQISGQTQLHIEENAENQLQIGVKELQLSGTLRERQFLLSSNLTAINTDIAIDDLLLRLGESRLAMKGKVGRQLGVNWELASQDLRDFHPELSGSMNGRGVLSGELARLKLQADLKGSAIQWADLLRVATIDADAQIDLTDNQQSKLHLRSTAIELDGRTIDSIDLHLNGKRQDHQIGLDIQSEIVTLSTLLRGRLGSDNHWTGQLQAMTLANELAGEWRLSEHGDIQLSADKQTLSPHCWRSNEQQICLQGDNSANGWQGELSVDAFSVDIVRPWIKEFATLSGLISGQLQLAMDAEEDITGSGELVLNDASLKLQAEGLNQQQPIDFDTVALRYQLSKQATNVAMTVAPDITGVQPLEARFQTTALQTFLAAPTDTEIALQVQTSVAELAELNLQTLVFDELSGNLQLHLDLQGTVNNPQITSAISLRDAQIFLVDLGINLQAINADITGDPLSGLKLLLQAQSAEGQLEIASDFTMNEAGWLLEATIKGESLELMNLPEAHVIASPDLQLSVSPETAKLTGSVVIPTAELAPMDFNTSVSPSNDVVIVGESDAEKMRLATDVDIAVQLGDKVMIRAMGFTGRLGGNLRIYGDAGELLMGNGEITVNDGIYAAYGQKLTINNGKIRFSGAAIDNPDLDIRAVRKGSGYEAGIHLSGPANNPQALLFSVPVMSQENILSYIILGRPLGQASSSDAAMLAAAATRLGVSNGNAISEQIAGTFGLDSVEFTGEDPDTAAVQIGKYLSPKLYVGYGIGIFEPVSTVQLRYTLSKIWTLQAESGTHSGVDLLYIHER